jgi:predicted transcriptional regulator
LSGLGNEVVEEPPRVPAVSVRRSVNADYLICIECGYKGQMLKKHLQSRHGLSVDQYKRRWKLSSEYPTTAPNYSEYRSQLAKSLGLGRAAAPATSEKPARRRSASTITRTRTSATKATTKTTTTKTASGKKSSAKKASSRSRKPSSKAASKAAAALDGRTA